MQFSPTSSGSSVNDDAVMGSVGPSRAGSAILWKAAQTGGVKLVFLLRLLVLARLLSPDDFGLLAIAMVAIALMAQLTDIGMIPALVQRQEPTETHYHVAWTVGLMRAFFIAAVVLLAAPLIAAAFAEPRATPLMRALALLPILQALASIRMAELMRKLHFRSLAFIRLPDAVGNTVVAIALAPSLGVWALVAGALAGPAVAAVASYIFAPYRPRLRLDRAEVTSLVRFGRWIFVTGLVALGGATLLRLLISRQLGTEALGIYYLAASLAFLPSEMAGQIVGEVTFPLYARLQTELARIANAFRSIVSGTFLIVTPAALLIIALTPGLVEHILGSRWEPAVQIIQVLAIVNVVGIVGDAVVPILNGVGKPNRVAVLEIVQTTLLILLLWVLMAAYGLLGAALAWIPAVGVAQLAAVWFCRDVLARPFEGLWSRFGAVLIGAAAAAATAWSVYAMFASLVGFLAAAAAGALVFCVLLFAFERLLALGFVQDLITAFPALSKLSVLKAAARPHRSP